MNTINETLQQEQEVLTHLKEVIDPELAVNIVDLGLIYSVQTTEEDLEVEITLSSPGCPLGDVIMGHARQVLQREYPRKKINLQLVWEPQWSPDMVSPAGKLMLGIE